MNVLMLIFSNLYFVVADLNSVRHYPPNRIKQAMLRMDCISDDGVILVLPAVLTLVYYGFGNGKLYYM